MVSEQPGRVMIMAGGTGGHVFPGLAIAEELVRQGMRVIWLGSPHGIEQRLVPERGYLLLTVPVSGLRGVGWRSWLVAPWRLLRALCLSLWFLFRYRPVLALGMGGFASGPGGVAAKLLRIPLLIHEQNAIAGTTNRLLFHLADRVMQAFPGTFPEHARVMHTGNPVRTAIRDLHCQSRRLHCEEHEGLNVLVLGGSQGAARLNRLLPARFAELDADVKIRVRHQTGTAHLQMAREAYARHNVEAELFPFADDMVSLYCWADLVICRAGAMTIAELTAVGVGSILIPFPFAIDDHQTVNASYLSDAGAAILLPETELDTSALSERLTELSCARQLLLDMAHRARDLFRTDTVDLIVGQCVEWAHA